MVVQQSEKCVQKSQPQPSTPLTIQMEVQAEEHEFPNKTYSTKGCSPIRQFEDGEDVDKQHATLATINRCSEENIHNIEIQATQQEKTPSESSASQVNSADTVIDHSDFSKDSEATSALGNIIKTCINDKKGKKGGQSSSPTAVSSMECRGQTSSLSGSEGEKEYKSCSESLATSDSQTNDDLLDFDHPIITFDPTTGPKGTFYKNREVRNHTQAFLDNFHDPCDEKQQPYPKSLPSVGEISKEGTSWANLWKASKVKCICIQKCH